MKLISLPLLADGGIRRTFEWGRIQSNADWILPICACVALGLFVRYMYRRDARELSPVMGWLLTALRSAAILGLLILYLQPQWRCEREEVLNSRVLLLVDTSLSMGLTDVNSPTSTATKSSPEDANPPSGSPTAASGRPPAARARDALATASKSRVGQVAEAFEKTDFLRQLRETHDVVVLRFDEDLNRIVTLDKREEGTRGSGLGTREIGTLPPAPNPQPLTPSFWPRTLLPVGAETRLGQALRQVLYDERSSPVSGIVVFTDGGQNAGISPDVATKAAREAKIPIFAVGLGSDRLPANVRVSDFIAPARAYPGDHYSVTGFIQAQGMAGRVVSVELLWREATATSAPRTGELVDTEEVTLGAAGEVVPVKFEMPPGETGRRTLCLRVNASDRDPGDNYREVDVEIVDRANRVLLYAGGPTREYRFLRNQLYRDSSTTVDVLLQTAQPGVSQDSNKILDDFPVTREEMYAYDCVVAFDPAWEKLDTRQIDLLEGWVAEQGGGLIVIAGPVHTGDAIAGWIGSEHTAKIRALYPVTFHRRFSVMETGSHASKEPWPLDFTPEGMEAEFLWLDDTQAASQQVWAGFAGVYGYFPVRGPKPGATVLARFSDPRAGEGDQQPVYFASQFYGSGRVFYMGSGEMWRLRRLDDSYFEQFYTKLIRHVSQGRLLRGSSRGVLLVGRDRYLLGNTVELRAQLTDAQFEPLRAKSVEVQAVHPDGSVHSVVLRPDSTRRGTFAGQFTVLEEGSYRLELPWGESDEQRITRRIQVKVPDLERQNPQRNDSQLRKIAGEDLPDEPGNKLARGKYYVGLNAALGPEAADPLTEQLRDRTKTIIFPIAPNPLWEETWLRWMMYCICGVLCVEWLIRRLCKLA